MFPLFFFSSRRRHTRFSRDWSSDVCSSDLTATVGVVVENVNDLFSIPLLLQYNPAVISVEDVRHGGFLSGGTQEIAIVHQHFKDNGQSIISATRGPKTAGVSGCGTLIGIVDNALAR